MLRLVSFETLLARWNMVLTVCCVFFYFATLDSSDVGIEEEGFGEMEEVQGQISQPRQAIY